MKRVFLTGGSGFVGSHLQSNLEKAGWKIFAPVFQLEDSASIEATCQEALTTLGGLDAVVHLAAVSSFGYCEKNPNQTFQINLTGTAHLARFIGQLAPSAHFVFASTAQVYAPPPGGVEGSASRAEPSVITESWPILPKSVYAQSKLFAEAVLEEFSLTYGNQATVLRIFNHSHKSQSPEFFLPHIYHELVKIKEGKRDPVISVGNLEVQRDIGAVSDLVSALQSVLENGPRLSKFEILNVCSGQARKLGRLADLLASHLEVKADFVPDKSKFRPNEPMILKGSFEKLSRQTGWYPTFVGDDKFLEGFLR